MAGSVPIYLSQGGTTLTVAAGGTLDTTNGNVTFGPVAIGPDGVDTANIQDDAVTTDKIADDAVTTDKIGPLAVTDAELAADSVITAKILNLNVTTGKLAAGAVTFAKAKVFVSTAQTGTGMSQNIPHGLGSTPSAIMFSPLDNSAIMDGLFTITPGASGSTNVVVTATTDLVFQVIAWA
jgi:hypothetical protein